jgi:CheY-like chemotaxis protein
VFGPLNDRQKHSLSTIERSGQHLLSLINDILELSKISAGKLELDLSMVSISELCESSLIFVKQQAFKKQIRLSSTIPKDLGSIAVDERRMRQVLINLLTNAVKFTPIGGRVTLRVYLEPLEINLAERIPLERVRIPSPVVSPEAKGAYCQLHDYSLCFSVIDTGIGIAAADQPKLFQPFVQIDGALNRQYEGTGLGLAMVKQIVELHGGLVSLRSELGNGSCFTASIPYMSSWSQQRLSMLPNRPSTRHDPDLLLSSPSSIEETSDASTTCPLILLAEDNEANISTISSYLIAKNYQIVVARDGQEAIDCVKTRQPDVILMDIQMPGIDGLEAIQQLRRDPTYADLPIIALTALAMTGDRDRCLEAGANNYLAKPIKLKELTTMIQKVLNPLLNVD